MPTLRGITYDDVDFRAINDETLTVSGTTDANGDIHTNLDVYHNYIIRSMASIHQVVIPFCTYYPNTDNYRWSFRVLDKYTNLQEKNTSVSLYVYYHYYKYHVSIEA